MFDISTYRGQSSNSNVGAKQLIDVVQSIPHLTKPDFMFGEAMSVEETSNHQDLFLNEFFYLVVAMSQGALSKNIINWVALNDIRSEAMSDIIAQRNSPSAARAIVDDAMGHRHGYGAAPRQYITGGYPPNQVGIGAQYNREMIMRQQEAMLRQQEAAMRSISGAFGPSGVHNPFGINQLNNPAAHGGLFDNPHGGQRFRSQQEHIVAMSVRSTINQELTILSSLYAKQCGEILDAVKFNNEIPFNNFIKKIHIVSLELTANVAKEHASLMILTMQRFSECYSIVRNAADSDMVRMYDNYVSPLAAQRSVDNDLRY